MAYTLNNKPINIDRPYVTEAGVKYANLRNPAIRTELGVVEVPDPEPYDQRFFWSPNNPKLLDDREESDEDGNPLYVQEYNPLTETMQNTSKRLVTKGLKSQWTAQVKATAGSLLAQTDWMVIRKAERDVAIPEAVQTYRAAVVAEADRLETAIAGVTSVEQLINTVNTMNWPKGD